MNTFNDSLERLLLDEGAPLAIESRQGATVFTASNEGTLHASIDDVKAVVDVVAPRRPDLAVELVAAVLAGNRCPSARERNSLSQMLYGLLSLEQSLPARGQILPRAECSEAVRVVLCDTSVWPPTKLMLVQSHGGTQPLDNQIAGLEATLRGDDRAGFANVADDAVVALFRATATGRRDLAVRAADLLGSPSDWSTATIAQCLRMQQTLHPEFGAAVSRMLPAGRDPRDLLESAGPLLLEIAGSGVYAFGGAFHITPSRIDVQRWVEVVPCAIAFPGDLHRQLRALAKVHGAHHLAAEVGVCLLMRNAGSPQFRAALARECVAWLEKSSTCLSHATCLLLQPQLAELPLEPQTRQRLLSYIPWNQRAPDAVAHEHSGEPHDVIGAGDDPDDRDVEGFHLSGPAHPLRPSPTLQPPIEPKPLVEAAPSPQATQPDDKHSVSANIKRLLGDELASRLFTDRVLLDLLFVTVDPASQSPMFEASTGDGGCMFKLRHAADEAILTQALARLARDHGAPLLAAELAAAWLAGPPTGPTQAALACAEYLDQATGVLTPATRGVISTALKARADVPDHIQRRLLATRSALDALKSLGCTSDAIRRALHDPVLAPHLDRLLDAMPWSVAGGDITFPEGRKGSVRAAVLQQLPQAFVRVDEPVLALQLLAGLIGSGAFSAAQNADMARQSARIVQDQAGIAPEPLPATATSTMTATAVTMTVLETTTVTAKTTQPDVTPEVRPVEAQPRSAEPPPFIRMRAVIANFKQKSPQRYKHLFQKSGKSQRPMFRHDAKSDALAARRDALFPPVIDDLLGMLRKWREERDHEIETVIAAALASHADCPRGLRVSLLARCDTLRTLHLPLAMQEALRPLLADAPNSVMVMSWMCPELVEKPMLPVLPHQVLIPASSAVAQLKLDHPGLHDEIFGTANESGRPLLVVFNGSVVAANGALSPHYAREWALLIRTIGFTANHDLAALVAAAVAGAPECPWLLKIECAQACARSISLCSGNLPENMQRALGRALEDDPAMAGEAFMRTLCTLTFPLDDAASATMDELGVPQDRLLRHAIADSVAQCFAAGGDYSIARVDGAVTVAVAERMFAPSRGNAVSTETAFLLQTFDHLARRGAPGLAALLATAALAHPDCTPDERKLLESARGKCTVMAGGDATTPRLESSSSRRAMPSMMSVGAAVARLRGERKDVHDRLFKRAAAGKPLMIHDEDSGILMATAEAFGPAFKSWSKLLTTIGTANPELATAIAAALMAAPACSPDQFLSATAWCLSSIDYAVGSLPPAMQKGIRHRVESLPAEELSAQDKDALLVSVAPLEATLPPATRAMTRQLGSAFGLDELSQAATAQYIGPLFAIPDARQAPYQLVVETGHVLIRARAGATTVTSAATDVGRLLDTLKTGFRHKGAATLATAIAAATAVHPACGLAEIRKLLAFCLQCRIEDGAALSTPMKAAIATLRPRCKGEDAHLLEQVLND